MRILLEALSCFAKEAEAAVRSDPDIAGWIFAYGPDRVVAQAVRIVGIVRKTRECARFPVESVETAVSSNPQHARFILKKDSYKVVTQARGISWVGLVMNELTTRCVIHIEPAEHRSSPERPVTIHEK